MTDNKTNVPSKEELNSVIWTTVLRSVVAGNCRPLETGREIKRLWLELFASNAGAPKESPEILKMEKQLLALGISPEQISQIRAQGKNRMRMLLADTLADRAAVAERKRILGF